MNCVFVIVTLFVVVQLEICTRMVLVLGAGLGCALEE